MRALLIIDMQQGDFPPVKERHDSEGVIDRINQLSAAFREKEELVIFIQHDGSGDSTFIPGSAHWKLLDALQIESSDLLIRKTTNSAFYKAGLEEVLQENNVQELYITGSATDFCVEATVQAALLNDYQTIVVGDTHTTGPRPNLTARQVIDHYNWVWSDLTPTQNGGSVNVKNFREVMDEL